jgi:hypothetical protein
MHFATEDRGVADAFGSFRWGVVHDGNVIAVEEANFCITIRKCPLACDARWQRGSC